MNAFVELPTGDEDEGIVTGDTGYGVGLNWNFAQELAGERRLPRSG